ncbi:TPA: capsule biosynthesis protein CapA [Campylobacter coli]|nr:capsule biosynthesis protein CapA [Campylobacter coli]
MDGMKPLIIAGRDDGFGERMRALLNALYISKKFGFKFGFVWRDVNNVQNLLDGRILIPWANLPTREYLFDESFIENYYREDIEFTYETPALWSLYRQSIQNILKKPYEKEWGWYSIQSDLSEYFTDVDEDEYRAELVSCWKQINFSPHVKKIFEKAHNKFLEIGKFVAIHIRTGEVIHDEFYRNILYHCRYKIFPYPFALEIALREIKKGYRIIFFGDDLNLIQNLKEHYSFNKQIQANIFSIDDIVACEQLDNGYDRLLFELVLMSKSEYIFGSGTTGFSRCASWIENKIFINIFDYLSLIEQYEVILKYIDIENIDDLHRSCNYFFLFLLSEQLNLNFDVKLRYLNKSLKHDPNSLNSEIFYINLLLQNKHFKEADDRLEQIICKNRKKFFDLLLGYGQNPTLPCDIYMNYYFKDFYQYDNIFHVACRIFSEFSRTESKINIYYPDFYPIIFDQFKKFIFEGLFKDNQEIGAVKKIRNHLAYKLGIAAIKNSKSLWGYIRMPYVLSYIKDIHKENQNKMNKKSVALEYYSDYDLALKEKESLAYKLGQTLIKAHQNWYKGGYIKFWFDLYKLKKEFKNKKG